MRANPPLSNGITLLRVARWAVLAFALLMVALTLLEMILLPDYAARHLTEYTPNAFWTPAQTQAALAELGWPTATTAWYSNLNDLTVVLISVLFALFIIWRKSNDWFGLYLIFIFASWGIGGSLTAPVVERWPILNGFSNLFGRIGWQLVFIMFYLFPDGRFVPRWTRWMPLVWLAANFVDGFNSMVFGLSLAGSAIGSQVYRYFWRSSAIEKQQTKIMVAVLVLMLVILLALAPSIFQPPPEDALGPTLEWAFFGGTLFRLSFLLFPAAMVLAVLRYRLWDIDVIIRRTLIYGVLSGLLVMFYFGSVVVLQQGFRALTGQGQDIAIILSTLAIAALFVPLRNRVQGAIDHHFFRRKYNAAHVLEQFATAARDEVDLSRLTDNLMNVVEETMQPEHVSVWLRGTEDRKRRNQGERRWTEG